MNMLEDRLIENNEKIELYNEVIRRSIQDLIYDPATSEKATIWMTKTKQISELTIQLLKYIDSLKTLNEVTNSRIENLYAELEKLKIQLLSIDLEIKDEFSNSFSFSIGRNLAETKDDFVRQFKNRTHRDKHALFTAIQNRLRLNENKILLFCQYQSTGSTADFFSDYELLISQNSKQVRQGDTLEVTVGMGSFTKKFLKTVVIYNSNLIPGEDGTVKFKFKVSESPGQHKLPVVINQLDPNTGLPTKRQVNVEYFVSNCN